MAREEAISRAGRVNPPEEGLGGVQGFWPGAKKVLSPETAMSKDRVFCLSPQQPSIKQLSHHRLEAGGFNSRLKARLLWED
jgi:hypothetical protein